MTGGESDAYHAYMGILNIRNIPEKVHRALRERAAKNGRSMEAEAREILTRACLPRQTLGARELQAWVARDFGGNPPQNVVERFLQERTADWNGVSD